MVQQLTARFGPCGAEGARPGGARCCWPDGRDLGRGRGPGFGGRCAHCHHQWPRGATCDARHPLALDQAGLPTGAMRINLDWRSIQPSQGRGVGVALTAVGQGEWLGLPGRHLRHRRYAGLGGYQCHEGSRVPRSPFCLAAQHPAFKEFMYRLSALPRSGDGL